jgi:hypothetical protein
MKTIQSALRSNELLWRSAMCRRAERHLISMSRIIADAACRVLSSRVDSTLITFNQPRALSTHAAFHSIEARRETSLEFMRSADITLELTGRDEPQ